MKLTSILCALALCTFTTATTASPSAAQKTATSSTNSCSKIPAFYWEIGSKSQTLASGAKGTAFSRSTSMPIASASKWIYGAYVAQRKTLSSTDIPFLNFTSGYTEGKVLCTRSPTVLSCSNTSPTKGFNSDHVGKFFYHGDHMQQHAVRMMGLGSLTPRGLAREVNAVLGLNVQYDTPQVAAGVTTSTAEYVKFMRNVMNDRYRLSQYLNKHTVCTKCATSAYSPTELELGYSIGHWVEQDGTVSSTGGSGFYPWISADKTVYGVVATKDQAGSGELSSACGALIRKAYSTGVVQ